MPADKRILVTGANGFVGSWLLRELLGRSADGAVSVVAAGHRGAADARLDVTDPDDVGRLVHSVRPTAIIHLAAVSAPVEARDFPRAAWAVNVMGTLNVAQAVLAYAPAALFVHVGSSECYGASFVGAPGPLAEDAPLDPASVYGATKASADLMIGQMARDGLKAIRFRPFNHTGPGQSDRFVLASFARQVAAIMAGGGARVIDVGNLSAVRDFLDVRDVVRAYADAALGVRPVRPGMIFNLASGVPRSVGMILDMLVEMSGTDMEIRIDPNRLRPSEIPSAVGNANAALEHLGWKPEIEFETTLSDVLADWRERLASPQRNG